MLNGKFIDNELHFFITADRFLRNMVRAIVGTLINVGIGKLQPEDMIKILASKNRAEAGYSVPCAWVIFNRSSLSGIY